ncbi:MAG TPA: hypothetical protein VFQ53_14900 [Kofleriaceae bacterium]|nr:hypothetical protein [Kofleriaceae bacterium]
MSLEIVRALGLVTVQDRGRRGHMHEGLAPGGALVPVLALAANRTVRNPDDAATLEVQGQLVVRAEREVELAVDARRHVLQFGDELVIASEPRRVTYLALRGGVAAPVILGSRSVQLSAGLGAPLRTGDRIETADLPERRDVESPPLTSLDGDVVRVLPGPDRGAFSDDALAVLCAAPYKLLPTSDRVGTRLAGGVLARAPAASIDRSRPMVRGAIEVPGDGQPIVLGPEHPTTGGYPVIGVIAHADLDRFFALRLGGSVRFTR